MLGQIIHRQVGFCKSFMRLRGLIIEHCQAPNIGRTLNLFPSFPRISVQDWMGLGSQEGKSLLPQEKAESVSIRMLLRTHERRVTG